MCSSDLVGILEAESGFNDAPVVIIVIVLTDVARGGEMHGVGALLAEDSTFFGDLFPHVVQWKDTMYLEDGLHRAVRTRACRMVR